MTVLHIHAPMDGWVRPLSDVPDKAFSDGLIGQGVAIEPLSGTLLAPCDATVAAVAQTGHAISLRTASGIELLLHIGIDTVLLGGSAFNVIVPMDGNVERGEQLIVFDMDLAAQRAPSLITPIVVTSPYIQIVFSAPAGPINAGDLLLTVEQQTSRNVRDIAETALIEQQVRVALADGIHARPAAEIVRIARGAEGSVYLAINNQQVDATSISALLTLGVKLGEDVNIIAHGARAQQTLLELAQYLTTPAPHEKKHVVTTQTTIQRSLSSTELTGIAAANGIAVGPIHKRDAPRSDVPAIHIRDSFEPDTGLERLDVALASVIRQLQQRSETASGPARDIALTHVALLQDEELLADARRLIAEGRDPASAWQQVCTAQIELLEQRTNVRISERAADMRDIQFQVLHALSGAPAKSGDTLPEGRWILVAEELLPSEFMSLDLSRVAGICTSRGGATSHVAILAASSAIPMLVAVGNDVLALERGTQVILDTERGVLDTAPTDAAIEEALTRASVRAAVILAERSEALSDCVMADATRIEVFANLTSLSDAHAAVSLGAEGCGLLRTEFLFSDRDSAPDEEEQTSAYSAIAQALASRPLIIRTLDVGGDKPIPYLPFPHEDNPALGLRGIRFSLANEDMLRTQLRAILRGVPLAQCHIMLPMVVEPDEVRLVRGILEYEAAGLGMSSVPPLGVMIETPAAAMLADQISKFADFMSVGSNDLTQYTLAMDRGNPQLASRLDPLHPAVIRLIARAAQGAAVHDRWFGICGSMASDPKAAALLVGLGVVELSVPPAAVPSIKSRLRTLTLSECQKAAQLALEASSPSAVQAILTEAFQ